MGESNLVHLPQDVDQILPCRLPVEFGHPTVSNQRRKHASEVVSSHDDGHASDVIAFPPLLSHGDAVWIVRYVHQGPNHDLVVHLRYRTLSRLIELKDK